MGQCVCLPTYYPMEGQPISIIEAMGFGNFIVTTNHAGIPDICCKKNSLFVQKGDSKSLFRAFKVVKINESFRVNKPKKLTVRKKEIFRGCLYLEFLRYLMKNKLIF